jgi:hypothetical protein
MRDIMRWSLAALAVVLAATLLLLVLTGAGCARSGTSVG